MRIIRLQVENFRNLEQVDIKPHPRLNYLYGHNGAGKTSVLEAVIALSRGRSFRTTQAIELIRKNHDFFRVFAETETQSGARQRLGVERGVNYWKARKDGRELAQLSHLTASLPLVLLEPNSHQLVSGPPDGRRKLLDWGVFHVEHDFLETWNRYSRALKQRNAALRNQQQSVLDSLDEVIAPLGERLGAQRERHAKTLAASLKELLPRINRRVEDVQVEYRRGWSGPGLSEALAVSRDRDLEKGATGAGPHRADLYLSLDGSPVRTILSRGEQKSLAAALLLSQAELLSSRGERPVLLLDDLVSEFDHERFLAVLDCALEVADQLWLSGTEQPDLDHHCRVFHVKHGATAKVV
jgi:DNA replication and repair protein RecF